VDEAVLLLEVLPVENRDLGPVLPDTRQLCSDESREGLGSEDLFGQDR